VSVPVNALTTTPRDYLYAVGCASDGYCVAVGYYLAKGGKDDAIAVARPSRGAPTERRPVR